MPGAEVGWWSELGDYWAAHDGRADAAVCYGEQLAWYADRLAEDRWVVGGAVFGWGNYSTWAKAEVAGTLVATAMMEYAGLNPAGDEEWSWETYGGAG